MPDLVDEWLKTQDEPWWKGWSDTEVGVGVSPIAEKATTVADLTIGDLGPSYIYDIQKGLLDAPENLARAIEWGVRQFSVENLAAFPENLGELWAFIARTMPGQEAWPDSWKDFSTKRKIIAGAQVASSAAIAIKLIQAGLAAPEAYRIARNYQQALRRAIGPIKGEVERRAAAKAIRKPFELGGTRPEIRRAARVFGKTRLSSKVRGMEEAFQVAKTGLPPRDPSLARMTKAQLEALFKPLKVYTEVVEKSELRTRMQQLFYKYVDSNTPLEIPANKVWQSTLDVTNGLLANLPETVTPKLSETIIKLGIPIAALTATQLATFGESTIMKGISLEEEKARQFAQAHPSEFQDYTRELAKKVTTEHDEVIKARVGEIYSQWQVLKKDNDITAMQAFEADLLEQKTDASVIALGKIHKELGVKVELETPVEPPETEMEQATGRLSFLAAEEETTQTENWEKWEEVQRLIRVVKARKEAITPEAPPTYDEADPIYDVGLRAQFDSSEHWSMSYQERTGVPVYSEATRPIIEAGKKKLRNNREYGNVITKMFKGFSKSDVAGLTYYMKMKQAKVEDLPVLSSEMLQLEADVRFMFDAGFVRFGVDPEKYIDDYLPLLSKAERDRLEKEIPVAWRGFPAEVIPFFKRVRKSLGGMIDAFTVEDLLRLYFNAGVFAEYRKTIHDVGAVSKGFPAPARNEIKKLAVFLTGGVGDFDKAFRTSISRTLHTVTGGNIDEDTDMMSAMVNAVYLGTLGFRPGSAIKNLTQSFHNWSEMPARWMAVGNKLYFSKEGKEILSKSGILTGFAPYVQRYVERYYGKSAWKKFLKGQAHLRNYGMVMFQGADHYNRGTIYLAEWTRMNHFIDQLKAGTIDEAAFYRKIDLSGLHPTIQKMVAPLVKEKAWPQLVDMVADQRQAMTQWRYQREIRPQWMRSGAGKVAGQFLTWPTYGAVMHAGRYKRTLEAIQKGQPQEAAYQIWKELKWLAMVATTVYLGKKAGLRLWPWFMFLPTQAAAAMQPIVNAYQAAVLKVKGYDWLAAKKWQDVKWSAKIFVPAGLEISDILRGLEEEVPLKTIGLPAYAGRSPVERPMYDMEVSEAPYELTAVDEWLKNQ